MRPKLLKRLTFRLPEELEADILEQASRRDCSANEVIVTALENEFARLLTYRLDYYGELRPMLGDAQGRQCPPNSRIVRPCLTREKVGA